MAERFKEWATAGSPIENALLIAAHLCDIEKVRELGANRGAWVERFLGAVGLPGGYAWCAAFVSFCLKSGGYTAGPKLPAAVRNWASWAKAEGRIVEAPRRGDLGFWLNPDGTGHIFFVANPAGVMVKTIEGNSNVAGSRDGDGVYRNNRPISGGPHKLQFIRL